MIKNLNFDFFRVVHQKGCKTTFENALLEIHKLNGKARVHHNGDYPVRLQTLGKHQDVYIGDIARIRMNDIPDKLKLSGEREEIELDDDQGLGEITSFLYHPETSVLMLIRNRNAVSLSAFSDYLAAKQPLHGVKYDLILQEEAYERLQKFKRIGRVDLEVAAPGNAKIFKHLDLSPKGLADLMNTTPRVRMSYAFSMSHDRDNSLPKSIISDIASKVMSFSLNKKEDIKMVVSGNEKDMEKEVIDLFTDALTEQVAVNIKNQRKMTDGQRHSAVVDAWNKRKSSMLKLFASTNK